MYGVFSCERMLCTCLFRALQFAREHTAQTNQTALIYNESRVLIGRTGPRTSKLSPFRIPTES